MNSKEAQEAFNKIQFYLMKLADYITQIETDNIELKKELKEQQH